MTRHITHCRPKVLRFPKPQLSLVISHFAERPQPGKQITNRSHPPLSLTQPNNIAQKAITTGNRKEFHQFSVLMIINATNISFNLSAQNDVNSGSDRIVGSSRRDGKSVGGAGRNQSDGDLWMNEWIFFILFDNHFSLQTVLTFGLWSSAVGDSTSTDEKIWALVTRPLTISWKMPSPPTPTTASNCSTLKVTSSSNQRAWLAWFVTRMSGTIPAAKNSGEIILW